MSGLAVLVRIREVNAFLRNVVVSRKRPEGRVRDALRQLLVAVA